MTKEITFLEAAHRVLAETGCAMSSREIIEKMIILGIRKKTGDTPEFTLNARISEDIKRNGENSIFKRTGRGIYALRDFSQKEYFTISHKRKIPERDLIMVIDPDKLLEIGDFHSIRNDYVSYVDFFLRNQNYFFVERRKAEQTEKLKQIVNYVMITYKDQILRYSRGEITNVKDDLKDYLSIGFGGHVQNADFNLFNNCIDGYLASTRREIHEETGILISTKNEPKFVGVLNDNSTSLGRHHLAFIHRYEVDSPTFEKREKSINRMGFVKQNDLVSDFSRFEYWSKLCILNYFSNKDTLICNIESSPNFSLSTSSDILLVVGFTGSGKSEACTLLEKEFGYQVIRVSTILKSILQVDKKISRKELQDAGYSFINSANGHEILAEAIYRQILSAPHKKWVIDGLRYPKTYDYLEKIIGKKISIIYIDTIVDDLYQYYLLRENRSSTFKEFLEIIYHPVEREVERFRSISNIVVYNHGSFRSYNNKMRSYFMKELMND